VTANAVKAMKIATGDIEDDIATPRKEGKGPAAVLPRLGCSSGASLACDASL